MAENVSLDKILSRERGQRDINVPVQLTTTKVGNHTHVIHTPLRVLEIQITVDQIDQEIVDLKLV